MARSTYHDQFVKLVDKGYLVQNSGNGYDFFETPQPRHDNIQKPVSAAGLNFEECPSTDTRIERPGQPVLPENTEINNRDSMIDSCINIDNESARQMEQFIPKVKEVVIKRPKAEGKNRPVCNPKPKEEEFVF